MQRSKIIKKNLKNLIPHEYHRKAPNFFSFCFLGCLN